MSKPINPRRIRSAADKIAKAFIDAVIADQAAMDAEIERNADEIDRVRRELVGVTAAARA